MRSMLNILVTAAAVMLTLGVSSSGTAAPRTPLCGPFLSVSAQAQTKQPVQEFQGTVERVGARYVLMDKASGARYQLDKQDKAREFVGKDVKITGTLDPSTNTIEVSEIERERGGR